MLPLSASVPPLTARATVWPLLVPKLSAIVPLNDPPPPTVSVDSVAEPLLAIVPEPERAPIGLAWLQPARSNLPPTDTAPPEGSALLAPSRSVPLEIVVPPP